MTKVSIFGQEEKTETKKLKPIEFVKYVDYVKGDIANSLYSARNYDHVQLLNKSGRYDVMMAWYNSGTPIIYLGHWNDGVVE